jgi:apolipoprotein N-acyltransferase
MPPYLQKFLRSPYSLAVLSGFLIGFSYIPFPFAFLPFCLVPLMIALSRAESWKHAFALGWVSQFLLTIIGFHWVAGTAVEFGHIPWVLSFLILVGFCCFASIHFAFAAAIWFHFTKGSKTYLSWIFFAFVFVSVETCYPMIFDWNLGYPWMASHFWISQWAEWIGFIGLSLFTVLLNVAIYFAIQFYQEQKNSVMFLLLVF